MTYNVYELEKIFARSARYALAEWGKDFSEADDLKQKLWEWYLETPSSQRLLQSVQRHEALNLVKNRAIQLLSKKRSADNKWFDYNHYDTKNVKDALSGKSDNPYLDSILPDAFKELEESNESYAEAIKSRYVARVVPKQGAEAVKLTRAILALTEEVNELAITADVADGDSDGPGSRSVAFPKKVNRDSGEEPSGRRAKGGHSDPTAAIALALMDDPVMREEFYHVEPITEFLRGPR